MYFGFSVAEQMEDSPSMKAGYVVKSSLLPEFKHKFEAFLVGSPDISESSDLEQFDPTGHLPGKII